MFVFVSCFLLQLACGIPGDTWLWHFYIVFISISAVADLACILSQNAKASITLAFNMIYLHKNKNN